MHLSVSDLSRSIGYYERAIGLSVITNQGSQASMGVGQTDLVVLTEEPGAPPSHGYTGLYHFALLVPRGKDLAGWLTHAAGARVGLTGIADHFVSEVYLSDPDDHGIEIYWDRPREVWEGRVARRMTTLRLDVDSLLSEVRESP